MQGLCLIVLSDSPLMTRKTTLAYPSKLGETVKKG